MSRFCISLACDLIEDVPQQVVDILAHMVGLADVQPTDLPKHRFFENEYWDSILRDTRLLWFPGEGIAALRRVSRYYRPMSEGGAEVFFYTFSLRLQDSDDGIVIYAEFFDWLAQYSHTQGFVGYWQYEYREHPMLIYFQNGLLATSEVNDPPTINEWS
jgi:hypothetical protein